MERNVNQYEDEIDLKELIVKIIKNFKYVILITSLFVVAALFYVFLAKPVYESKALVEIGYIKRDGKNEYIDNPERLINELNTLFVEKNKYENKKVENYIFQVKRSNKNSNFIEITAHGTDPEKASKEIQKVLSYIQKKHSEVLDEYVENIKFQLDSLDNEIYLLKNDRIVKIDQEMFTLKNTKVKAIEDNITTLKNIATKEIEEKIETLKNVRVKEVEESINALKNVELKKIEDEITTLKKDKLASIEDKIAITNKEVIPNINKKIEMYENEISKSQQTLLNLNANIAKTKEADQALAALAIVQQRDLQNKIMQLQNTIIDLKKEKEQLINVYLKDLAREKEKLLSVDLVQLESEKDKLLNIDLVQLQREKDQLLNVELAQLIRERDKILNIDIPQLEREKDNLLTIELEKLNMLKKNLLEIELPKIEKKKKLLQYSISKAGYKNTETVGGILAKEHPIKPKKRLILAISFVTGFIISIFFVFFKDFAKEIYHEIRR